MPDTFSENFTIINELGLHARAAAAFVKTANKFVSSINVTKESVTVNGKSIMGVLMLAAAKGSVINIEAKGSDSDKAVQALGNLIDDKFGEDS